MQRRSSRKLRIEIEFSRRNQRIPHLSRELAIPAVFSEADMQNITVRAPSEHADAAAQSEVYNTWIGHSPQI